MKKVCVIGLGYIGLPTAIVLSEQAFQVVGYDIDKDKVARINEGESIIKEPGLFDKLQTALKSKRFCASTKIEPADYFIIAVPTPFAENKKPDISYVLAAGKALAPVLQKGNVVIIESTIPVKTTDYFAQSLEKMTGMTVEKDFYVSHCPERVLPGNIFYELVHNTRIIGGGIQSVEKARELYASFVTGKLYVTSAITAELVKLVENSSRDVSIAFANQVASMAFSVGLDPYSVIDLANEHPRINILKPSCGVGGHCIAVDPWFLIDTFKEQTTLLKAAREVNNEKPNEIIASINNYVEERNKQYSSLCTILVLGLTYKPDIDDLRESPALYIAQQLQKDHGKKYNLLVCEPHVPERELKKWFKRKQVVSLDEGVKKADSVVALVAHKPFKSALATYDLKVKTVFDYCGLWSSLTAAKWYTKKIDKERISFISPRDISNVKEQVI